MRGARISLLAMWLAAVHPGAAQAQDGRDSGFARRVLAAHNTERDSAGAAHLAWSDRLADQADEWARDLARRGVLEHARDRGGAGENLWIGTAGAFTPEMMIGAFVAEKADFRPGVFPAVAVRGDWSRVGHYTQLIWPTTREVGCALGQGATVDVLVCRYWPAGNVYGGRVP